MRKEGEERFVFICNRDRSSAVDTTVKLKGIWDIIKMDTLSGEESKVNAYFSEASWTIFPYKFEGCASLLLRLSPSNKSTGYELSYLEPNKESTVASEIVLKGTRILFLLL